MIAAIILIVLSLLVSATIIRVALYGKSIFRPDFERVDRMFSQKRNVITNWDTTFGQITYYVLLLLLLFFSATTIFVISVTIISAIMA